jgi:hypothetical protein
MDDQARSGFELPPDGGPDKPAKRGRGETDEKRRAALLAALALGPIMLTLRGTPGQAQTTTDLQTAGWWQPPKVASCTKGAMSAGRGDNKITYTEYLTCKKD